MREYRRREPHRLVQQDLTRRVRNVILSANHMAHVHQRIVHNDGEVVCRVAVRSDNDWIADDVRVEPDVTTHDVGEDDISVSRNAKTDGRPFPTLYAGARAIRR